MGTKVGTPGKNRAHGGRGMEKEKKGKGERGGGKRKRRVGAKVGTPGKNRAHGGKGMEKEKKGRRGKKGEREKKERGWTRGGGRWKAADGVSRQTMFAKTDTVHGKRLRGDARCRRKESP